MALSADEQRALAEIERRLVTDDPGLATCLTAFRRPGPARVLRSPRARIVGSLFTVLLYAMVPFRTHGARTPATPSAGTPGNVSIMATGTGGQPHSNPPASASTSTAGSASSVLKSAAPSAGQSAGTGQAKPTGNQAAGQVASPVTG